MAGGTMPAAAAVGMPGMLQAPPGQLAKPEELSHPCQEQLPDLKYCINDNPPVADGTWVFDMSTAEAVALGFQHYLTMLGSSVMIPSLLVPMMGGNDHDKSRVIQTILFVSGINTLLQTTFGSRLPTVVGGSFAFIIPTITIINSEKLLAINDDQERFKYTMRAVQGALISASSLHIVLGFSGLWGILTRFISPIVIAPTITMVGLGLYEYGFPIVGKCVEIGIPQIIVTLIFSQISEQRFWGAHSILSLSRNGLIFGSAICLLPKYLKHVRVRHVPIFELFPVILGVTITWVYAHLLTVSGAYEHASPKGQMHCRTDRSHIIGASPWIRIPWPLQWGPPTFDAAHAFGIMAGAFAALIESTGDYYAVSRLAGATPPPPYVISRGIGWEGLGIFLDGMFGTAAGSTISAENIGVIGVTRVGSRRVVQIAAAFMISFSLLGKFGGIFASIPQPMVAGVCCIMFAYLAAIGISSLQFCNMNLGRNIFIVGFSLFMGLSVPQYFKEYMVAAGHGPAHTHARWQPDDGFNRIEYVNHRPVFNDILNTTFSSSAIVALMVAVVLDNTLKATRKDRGLLWWDKFRPFSSDPRNLEFYGLPMGLNKFFPPT